MNKKLLPLVLLTPLLSSCSLFGVPSGVSFNNNDYKLCSVSYLHPNVYPDTSHGENVFFMKFYKVDCCTSYDAYVSYIGYANGPKIYFNELDYDEADEYYSNLDNYNFSYKLGNNLDSKQEGNLDNKDISNDIFNKLFDYTYNNGTNPFDSKKNDESSFIVPVANHDDWMADQISFYAVSKDEAFKACSDTLIKYQGRIDLLISYDLSNDDNYTMKLKHLPDEINDYLVTFYQNHVSEK